MARTTWKASVEQVAYLVDPAEIQVFPTCIDLMAFDLADHSSTKEKATICSATMSSGAQEWNAAILACLEKSLPSLQLRTVYGRSLNLEHLRMQDRPGRQASVAAAFGRAGFPTTLRTRG